MRIAITGGLGRLGQYVVRALADLIHQANPKWRVAITGGMDEPQFAKYLYGHLDIFIMCAPTSVE